MQNARRKQWLRKDPEELKVRRRIDTGRVAHSPLLGCGADDRRRRRGARQTREVAAGDYARSRRILPREAAPAPGRQPAEISILQRGAGRAGKGYNGASDPRGHTDRRGRAAERDFDPAGVDAAASGFVCARRPRRVPLRMIESRRPVRPGPADRRRHDARRRRARGGRSDLDTERAAEAPPRGWRR